MEKIDWTKIRYEDVLKAIEIFNRENPDYPEPKVTFLIHNKQKLPAKHIRGMAYKVAYGKEIKKSDFGGGMETVKFFERLGFEIDYRGKSTRERKRDKVKKGQINNEENKVESNKVENNNLEEDSTRRIKIPGKGVIEQKNALQLLLNKIYKGDIVCEKTFPWLKSPKEIKGSYIDIFEGLKSYRGDSTFAKRNVALRCDFVCESEKTIIEYDERQHFTEARRRALLSYKNIKLAYDRELWIKACEDIQAKDNHPFNRDEARAYYDSVRDIEANKNGYKLVRIMHGQMDFESDDAEASLKKILGLDNASEVKDIKIKGQAKDGLKIGLYLQTDELKNEKAFNKAIEKLKESKFDIFVLPEFSYFPFVSMVEGSDLTNKDDLDKIYEASLDLSQEIGKAIIISSVDKFGTIFSLYANAFADEKETELALYIKHTMTSYSAFDFDKYDELAQTMFEPILFKGYKIGLTICYDCNHSLFSRIYGLQNIDIIINSTGGNVVYDKWYKYNKARAIENSCFNFVTMGGNGLIKNPKAYVYGFNPNGKELVAINGNKENPKNNCPGSIYIYDTALDDGGSSRDLSLNQKKSINKNYHLKFPLDKSWEVLKKAKKLTESLYVQEMGNLNIIYILVEGDDIFKAEKFLPLLYSKELKELNNKRYIIINRYETIDEEFFENKLSILLKVRSMENFCGVILESKNINNCYQAGKNRTAQVIEAIAGEYRIDLSRTTGPEAIWKNKDGMRASWRDNYEWLVDKISKEGVRNCNN